jgi:putative endonuclease
MSRRSDRRSASHRRPGACVAVAREASEGAKADISATRFECRIAGSSYPGGVRSTSRIKRWRPPGAGLAPSRTMKGIGKRFVYVLRSDRDPSRHYIGTTSEVENRLDWHNHGPCGHTVRHRPCSLAVVVELPAEQLAARFEKYLKTGSGRAFARRHFSAGAPCAPGGTPGLTGPRTPTDAY